ncbi:MAG: crotonase [Thermotogae bacterium]|nr:crotonase [Thermotogota bacterium]
MRFVEVEKREGIAIVRINRPDKLNALAPEVLEDLEKAVDMINEDEEVRVAIITGTGKAFVAGADIKYIGTLDEEGGYRMAKFGQRVFSKIEDSPKVFIAAVNGYALGGGSELALACDIIVASENAVFGQPEVDLGIMPGWGATQRMTRKLGQGWAKYLILTGERISAHKAYEIGLVQKVVNHDNLMDEAINLAQTLASKGPLAVSLSKEAINRAFQLGDFGFEYEAKLFARTVGSEDKDEGVRAFFEKRKPNFKGK